MLKLSGHDLNVSTRHCLERVLSVSYRIDGTDVSVSIDTFTPTSLIRLKFSQCEISVSS